MKKIGARNIASLVCHAAVTDLARIFHESIRRIDKV